MEYNRKLPIGIQSFEDLRSNGYLYIDKTRFIWKLVNSGKSYFLSRPRRFGKSLLVSTIKGYFEGKRDLFDGLEIQSLEDAKADSWETYPVLHFDFNVDKYEVRSDLEGVLNHSLSTLEKEYGINNPESSSSIRLGNLIKGAYETTGKKVVVLIDEYDKPLLQTMFTDDDSKLNDEYRSILKGFYSVFKSYDKYLRFVLLTGVTKFSKVSIFSDLNNLDDISMIEEYSDICGITQVELESIFNPEIQAICDKHAYSYEEILSKLKRKYNGYLFNRFGIAVYNPFSILKTLRYGEFDNYWFATGTPTFLVEFLKKAQYDVPNLDNDIQIDSRNIDAYKEEDNIIPILFQSGYITIKDYDQEFGLYILGFPNDEVRYGFLDNLFPLYTKMSSDKTGYSIASFVKDIRKGDVDSFMERMKSIISGIPYANFSDSEAFSLREYNYQTTIYLIFALMGQFTQTEAHCSTGRSDCVVHTSGHIYVFEFKLSGNSDPEDALKQIEEKGYVQPHLSSGKTVVAIGSSFDEKMKTIKGWAIRQY